MSKAMTREDVLVLHPTLDPAVADTVLHEVRQAHEAHANGNLGMARVCCRRAAGFLLIALRGLPPNASALRALEDASQDPSLPSSLRAAASRLRASRAIPGEATTDPIDDVMMILHGETGAERPGAQR